jgi:cytochrome c556
MKDTSDRNGLEVTETISVAGSVAGSILAMASQQLIYAAAPLTLALGLNLINRRRFEQKFQQNMLAILSDVNSRITETDQTLSGEMRSVKDSVKLLSSAPDPINIDPIQQELSGLQKRFDTLEAAISNLTFAASKDNTPLSTDSQPQTAVELPPPFDPTYLEQQIAELKTAFIPAAQTTSQSVAQQELKAVNREIQQMQGSLFSLNQAFSQRSEPNQIEELKQVTASIQQQLAQLPPAPPSFDSTPLEQKIQQLQGSVSSLTEEFKQRPEPQQIEAVRQFATAVQQQVSQLPPAPPPFDPTPLEQQLQQLKTAIAQIESAQTNFNAELAKLPQLFDSVAQIQQHQSELQQLTATLDEKIGSLQKFQTQSSSMSPGVTFPNGTQLKFNRNNKRVASLLAMAEAYGIGKEVQLVTQVAEQHHLTLNAWPTNLIFGPATHLIAAGIRHRSQCLFTMSGQPTKDGKVQLWTSSQAFADFYPVIPYTVTSILGFDGWQEMEKPQIEGFVAKLNQLFESFEQRKFEFN